MPPPTSPDGPTHSEGFAQLLRRLHDDPDEAAREYERLRHRLVRFFDWRGITMPDEQADEVLDRLVRKVEEAAVQDVSKYAYGIARLVALEARRRPLAVSLDDVGQDRLAGASADADDDHPLQDCFDRCLSTLPTEQRQVLLGYYDGERQTKIANRRRLATALGVSENALRSRVQRQRDLLERCVRTCDEAGRLAS